MTIDERLEALAQSVELMQRMQSDFERTVRQALDTLMSLHGDMQRGMAQLQRTTDQLAHIAIAH